MPGRRRRRRPGPRRQLREIDGEPGPVERTLAWALRQLEASLGPLRVASLYRSRARLARSPSRTS